MSRPTPRFSLDFFGFITRTPGSISFRQSAQPTLPIFYIYFLIFPSVPFLINTLACLPLGGRCCVIGQAKCQSSFFQQVLASSKHFDSVTVFFNHNIKALFPAPLLPAQSA